MLQVREKPPLRLHEHIITPSGRRYRWADDECDPASVPSGRRHSSSMPGGWESHDVTLPRKPGIDYFDLDRLSTVRLLGAGGEIAGEYRLRSAPQTAGDQMAIGPSSEGWKAALEDDKSVRVLYVDRDLSRWAGPSVQRRLNLNASFGIADPSVEADAATGQPAVKTSVTGPWGTSSGRPVSSAWYDAGAGLRIGSLYYAWKRGVNVDSANANWTWRALLVSDDIQTLFDQSGNLRAAGPSAGTLVAGGVRRHAVVELFFANIASGTQGADYPILWTCLAVYGDHGLAKRGDEGATNAKGFYASDIVAHAVPTFAPALSLDPADIEQSGFVIPHIAFTEPTTAAEIVRQATRFGLQDWAVWENRRFVWHTPGVRGRKWRAQIGPAKLEETGATVDRLWESIIVQFQDVNGTTKTVGPPGSGCDVEDAALKDDDPLNPANQAGITRRDLLQMQTSTAAAAIEVGRRFLENSKQLDRSGKATIVGHIEDDRGVTRPYWAIRAGDQISFTDASDQSYRRIVKVDCDDAARSATLDLDGPPEGLDALLERLAVVLVPLGL